MTHPDENSSGRYDDEERDVRRLLANVGIGQPPTTSERERVANTMWAAFDTTATDATGTTNDDRIGSGQVTILPTQRGNTPNGPPERSTHHRPSTRILLWAAILLVALMAAGLLGKAVGESRRPASPPETDRTTLLVGDSGVSFDAVNNYEMRRLGPDLVTFTAGPHNLNNHRRITVAQAATPFDGLDAEEFFTNAGLEADAAYSPPGSSAWMLSTVNNTCAAGSDCVVIAELADGSPLTVPSYSRVEVYDNGDRDPIVIVSEAGSPSSGPALIGVELTP